MKELPSFEPTEMMEINWEGGCRSLWHWNCDKSRNGSGVIGEVKQEKDRTLVRCLHCGRAGWLPVGAVTACVPVEFRYAT
jgi:hypothetical protein